MTRSELHAAVWARPMFHVARALGVGERALAAACKRSEVPTPPRGYWRQVSTGQTPPQAELPGDGKQPVKLPASQGAVRSEAATGHAAWPFRQPDGAAVADEKVPQPMTGPRSTGPLSAAVDVSVIRLLAGNLKEYEAASALVALVVDRAASLPADESMRVLRWALAIREELARLDPAAALLRLVLLPAKDLA